MPHVAAGCLGQSFTSYPMTHTALARKYRPTRFSDLVAQEHVAAGLAGAVAKGRVAHAYLLTGPRGVGKTSAARILAMVLNCQDRASAPSEGEPCGKCASCTRIWSGGANLDVVEIDAASNRGVDDARELRERAMYAASAPGGYKVYIVDEAHMLTREAWNALLKILEEPPPGVVFVFATTEPHKITNTAAPVMSRVQRFDFRRIGPNAIVERLRFVARSEKIEVEEDALHIIARVAGGGMRDALSLVDQALAFGDGEVTARRVRDALGLIDDESYAELLDIVARHRTADVFPFVGRLVEGGADLVEFVKGVGETLRSLLIHMLGGQPEGLTDTLKSAIERFSSVLMPGDVLRMLKLLSATEEPIRRSPNARLHVETLLVQWCLLDRTVELSDVVNLLGGEGTGSIPALNERMVTRKPRVTQPVSRGATVGSAASIDGLLSAESLRRAWPEILNVVGQRRRMVQEALGHATPVAVDGDVVVLEVTQCEVHLEGLRRSVGLIEEVIAEVLGVGKVKVEYRPQDGDASTESSDPPQRLNRDSEQAERLRRYRQKDPALDAIAEALDLEVIE
jgi:DNA polymerase-3 subunit gamma/tau